MAVVWSCNEWDPLEEVIVGNPLGARFPTADPSTQLAEFPGRSLEDIPQGPFSKQGIVRHLVLIITFLYLKKYWYTVTFLEQKSFQ